MKTRSILLALAVCFAGVVASFAADQSGTWKLNVGKSKFGPGAARNDTVVITATGDDMKVVVDGTDGGGKPTHNEWVGKFDGKDYPVTGDSAVDMRSYKPTDDHTWAVAQKKGGKVTTSGSVVISADGKTRTVTVKGTDPQGKPTSSTAVYEKQ
jgi:uncharacterized protein YaiE (UPF0345 family)